jgi:hypothetical protein
LAVVGVEGEHYDVVQLKGELGEAFMGFGAHDLCVLEIFPERGPYFSVDGIGGFCKAAEGQEEGGCEGDDLFHKTYFKCFCFFGLLT